MRLGNLISRLIVMILIACPAIAAQTYFPLGTLDEKPDASQFRDGWYSEQLKALREPSLWELSKVPTTETYRFLWLRSFDRPISVRIDIATDGTSVVTTKIANGAGGGKPGKLVKRRTRTLTKQETDFVLDRIRESGFWGLETYLKPDPRVINLDGAQWILEGTKEGKYHLTDRWSPKDGPVRDMGIFMLIDLAKLKLLYEEVY
jgi:hypothetical protein